MSTKQNTIKWLDVMAEVTGRRLAVYDALLQWHVVDPKRWGEELRWLSYHRMAWWDADDELWRPRKVEQAQTLWEREGPFVQAAKGSENGVSPQSTQSTQSADTEVTEAIPEPLRVHERAAKTVEMEELLR